MNRLMSHWMVALALACASSAGCKHHGGILGVDRCADVPPGAIPEPPGNKLCQWQSAQASNAYADQFTLYQSDFVGDSPGLAPGAMRRIDQHAHFGNAHSVPWIIEPSSDPSLNNARLQTVIGYLAERGVGATEVIIATPPAIGLVGPQAERAASRVTSGNNRSAGASFGRSASLGGPGGSGFGGIYQ